MTYKYTGDVIGGEVKAACAAEAGQLSVCDWSEVDCRETSLKTAQSQPRAPWQLDHSHRVTTDVQHLDQQTTSSSFAQS